MAASLLSASLSTDDYGQRTLGQHTQSHDDMESEIATYKWRLYNLLHANTLVQAQGGRREVSY